MSKIFTKILFFALLLTFFISCNITKYVQDDENLLKKNTILVNDKKKLESELDDYLVQRPNETLLSLPLSLGFYNIGDLDFEKTFDQWKMNHTRKNDSYDKIFSKKQTRVIYNTRKGFNNWFLTKGQAPIIYDDNKSAKSAKSLKDYFISKGYFEANVTYDSILIKKKQVGVNYKITTNNRYYIDSISVEIESSILDSIYQEGKVNSAIKNKDPFVFDNFKKEEKRLINLFRNSGIYLFGDNAIGFGADSIKQDYHKNIVLKIPNKTIKENDVIYKIPYKIQKVKEVNVYTDFSLENRGKNFRDSIKYKGYNFYSYGKMKFKPKHLMNSLFITPNGVYKDAEKTLTRSHLRKLKTFSSMINIDYTENDDESLISDIYLKPLKKFGATFDLDGITSNIKPYGILAKSSFIGRNIFKGSEILELSFQGSILNSASVESNDQAFLGFNAWELISSASLKFPRIVFPINTSSIIPKYMAPNTSINASVSFQKNIGLDRQIITGGIGYSWKSSKKMAHNLDLFNLQYIKNKNIDSYFTKYRSEYRKLKVASNNISEGILPENRIENYEEIIDYMNTFLNVKENQNTYPKEYNTVSDVNERQDILTEDVMVPVISYSFVYNTRKNIYDNNFYYLTTRFVSAGVLSTLLATKTSETGRKMLSDLPVVQYFKVEAEYKKYWELKKDNILVFRTFAGVVIPYGNSNSVPFSRSYSAGGSNEIRAWRTYDLGPGSQLSNLEYNVATFKLTSNLEYRFKITNKIYSALFIDAGNIWDVTSSNLYTDDAKLKDFSSLNNIAIGSGFGLRYDFGFLVFRLDLGFKTYEPYMVSKKKWFNNYNFGAAVYNIGINYPF